MANNYHHIAELIDANLAAMRQTNAHISIICHYANGLLARQYKPGFLYATLKCNHKIRAYSYQMLLDEIALVEKYNTVEEALATGKSWKELRKELQGDNTSED